MSNIMLMKGVLMIIVLMGLFPSGLCIKCYVGTGKENSSSVIEEDGFTTCIITQAIVGITSSFTRGGLNSTESTGCEDQVEEGVSSRICHCDTELCNNVTDMGVPLPGETIKCYSGNGNVGSPGIKEVDGFKSCAVSTVVVEEMKIITRTGLPLMFNTSIIEEGEEITDRICYCNTDLCNGEGSTIKCYVGVGNVGSQNVKEIEGYESCSVSTYVADDVKVITRAGSVMKLTPCIGEEDIINCTSCLEEDNNGTTIESCNCDTDLCNSAGSTVKCYVGVGTAGSHSVDDIEGFESCLVSTETSNGQRVVTHAGIAVKMNTSCFEEQVNGTKTRLCYCNEDLCNRTADRFRAIVVEIVKSFAEWIESLFDNDNHEDESKEISTDIKEQCYEAGYVAKNRTKWDKFLSYFSNH